eukprot:8172287-Pyramimonas_sp.AAC.1
MAMAASIDPADAIELVAKVIVMHMSRKTFNHTRPVSVVSNQSRGSPMVATQIRLNSLAIAINYCNNDK